LQRSCKFLHFAPPIPVAIATTSSFRALLPMKLLVASLQQVPARNTELLQAKPKLLQPVAALIARVFRRFSHAFPLCARWSYAPCTNEKARLRIGNCSSPAHEFAPFFNLFCRQRRFAKRTRHESIRDKTSRLTPHVQVQQTR
jgi:hypothetical protein